MRDLGPLSRKFCLSGPYTSNTKQDKQNREVQKKVMNYLDLPQIQNRNFFDDMFLLSISGLVPCDQLLMRLQDAQIQDQIEIPEEGLLGHPK